MKEVERVVRKCCTKLDKYIKKKDFSIDSGVIRVLKTLQKVTMNRYLLKSTKIGSKLNEMRKNTKVLAPEISMLGRAIIKKWKQEVAEDTTRHSKKESSDKKLQACSSVTGPAPRSKEEFSPKPILLSDHLNSHHSKETMFSAASLLVDSSPAEANLPEAKVEVAFPVFQKTVFTHSAADAADSCIQEETKKAPQKFNVPTVLLRFYSLDKSSESDPAIKESLVRIANGERKWIGVDGVLDFNNNWRPWREDFFSPFLESDLGKVAPYTFVLRKHS